MRTITAEDILGQLDSLDRTGVNPRQDTTCVYTGYDDSHCIAGQVLVNLGLPVPSWAEAENREGINLLIEGSYWLEVEFTEQAEELLGRAQSAADGLTVSGDYVELLSANVGDLRPWGQVIDYVRALAAEW